MNNTIPDHIDQMLNQISPTIKKFKFTFIYMGINREVTCKGTDMEDACKTLSSYYPGKLDIFNCEAL